MNSKLVPTPAGDALMRELFETVSFVDGREDWENDPGSAFEDDGGKALALEQQFVGSQHGELTMK